MTSSLTPLRNILVATDLQADSRTLLDLAGFLGKSAGADLHLIHVMEVDQGASGPGSATVMEQRAADALRALDAQADTLREMGAAVESTFRAKSGPAHQRILESLERTGSDLVIMGSHARGGRGHRLGSTADRVLRTAAVPSLVVRGEAKLPVSRVAATVDFSRPSRFAVRRLLDWLPAFAGPEGAAAVDLVHVGDEGLHMLDPHLGSTLERMLAAELEHAGPHHRGNGSLETRLLWGTHPVETLAENATRAGYDLLVTGTHGRGPVVRMLVGSVAMGLCQTSPCPILVVPPES